MNGYEQSILLLCQISFYPSSISAPLLLSPGRERRMEFREQKDMTRHPKHTFFTFWSCRSYRVCVNIVMPYEAPTISSRKGIPKTLGCFLTNRFIALGVRDLEGNTAIWFQCKLRSGCGTNRFDRTAVSSHCACTFLLSALVSTRIRLPQFLILCQRINPV